MNARIRKGIFWSTIVASLVVVISFLFNFIGGTTTLAAGFHNHGRGGGMLTQNNLGHQPMMNAFHHETGFPWLGFVLFLIIGIVVMIVLVKWLQKKSTASSMDQFIDTSLMSSPKPLMNHNNASILDEWEKNMVNKKEIK